jgi:hypothetical protein
MKRLFFVLMIFVFCPSTEGFAATLVSDNFDSYTAGNLPPSPWMVYEQGGNIRVNNSVSFSSPNSVAVTSSNTGTDTPYFLRTYTSVSNRVIYEAYLRTNNVTNETLVMGGFGIGSGNQIGPSISLGGPSGGYLACWDGSSWTNVMAISNNTWYHIRLDADIPSKTFDVYVDDMTIPKVTNVGFQDTSLNSLSSVVFIVYGSSYNPNPPTPGVDYAYVDNVFVSTPTVATTAVPTMTEWGMIIFMVLAGLGATYYLRKQKTAKS